ncbi:DUF3291 domain-containing protein [Euzebya sp.]|uniref:DUF3291 domain-containing protein n=1 Tax=Euzebya sp. TaxID=1971409 RepID=UPI003518B205
MSHHLAQVNVARMRHPLDDPRMAGFVDNLDRINGIGAAAPGFVWIMQEGDAHGGNTDVAFFGDPGLISNITVWQDLESLLDFTLRTEHVDFLRRRREWFLPAEAPSVALWWVPESHLPDVAEAEDRLLHLRAHGPSPTAFTFRRAFEPPEVAAAG